jgi:aerobic-type carbon monoxide dehydrogenase small subunit (CoxS/CutS family)
MPRVTELNVNGQSRSLDADSRRSLLSVLRDDLDLTGTKYGCGEGQCGACTVLINGEATRSCLTMAGSVEGKKIRTIEGLETDGKLHPMQEAFLKEGALQCGYCTAGMIMSSLGLLESKREPTNDEILQHMNGNVCRCGTYPRILAAIRRGQKAMQEADHE